MTTQTQPAPSTLVYLFADQFSNATKGLGALAGGMVAPRTGTKVSLQPVAISLYVAAIMELVQSGTASFETVEVKKLFGKENVLALKLEKAPAAGLSALALKLVAAAQAAKQPKDRRVRELVIRVVGGRGSTNYPWLMAIAPVIAEAEGCGYVRRPEQKPGLMKSLFNPLEAKTQVEAVPELVDAFAPGLEALKQQLARFEQSLGQTAATLRKEIENGVDDCMDRSD